MATYAETQQRAGYQQAQTWSTYSAQYLAQGNNNPAVAITISRDKTHGEEKDLANLVERHGARDDASQGRASTDPAHANPMRSNVVDNGLLPPGGSQIPQDPNAAEFFNPLMRPMPGQGPPDANSNHALQDYQMQLMLLEQQNKKRLLMARQEQDSILNGPDGPMPASGQLRNYTPVMSQSKSVASLVSRPNEQTRRGVSKSFSGVDQYDLDNSNVPAMGNMAIMAGPSGQSMQPPSSYPEFTQMMTTRESAYSPTNTTIQSGTAEVSSMSHNYLDWNHEISDLISTRIETSPVHSLQYRGDSSAPAASARLSDQNTKSYRRRAPRQTCIQETDSSDDEDGCVSTDKRLDHSRWNKTVGDRLPVPRQQWPSHHLSSGSRPVTPLPTSQKKNSISNHYPDIHDDTHFEEHQSHEKLSTRHLGPVDCRIESDLEPTDCKASTFQPAEQKTASSGISDTRVRLQELMNKNEGVSEAAFVNSLRSLLDPLESYRERSDKGVRQSSEAYFVILYQVRCGRSGLTSTFRAPPIFVQPDRPNGHMRGHGNIKNMELFLEQQRDLPFIVVKKYRCCHARKTRVIEEEPIPDTECFVINSPTLQSALHAVARTSSRAQIYPKFKMRGTISAPYLWYYHERQYLRQPRTDLSGAQNFCVLTLFQQYIDMHMGHRYAKVDAQIASRCISDEHLVFLFVPFEVIVERDTDRGEQYDRACLQIEWPIPRSDDEQDAQDETESSSSESEDSAITEPDTKGNKRFSVRVQHCTFDESFRTALKSVALSYGIDQSETISIECLPIVPLRFLSDDVWTRLMKRGQMFWNFHFKPRKLVSYNGWDSTKSSYHSNSRVMVDMQTYHKFHPYNQIKHFGDELGAEEIALDRFLERYVLLLPPEVPGFDMQEKKWYTMLVDNMDKVNWNQGAFDSLVADSETKELIMALVTNKIEASKSTDIMSGKGNGLIVLLHGGPGTGKTLTAESVAEYAKKPLYRVTCGDVGTEPQEVEKYLEDVLYLGKIWDCVVLLDEAEVFLQTRNLEDLKRNALVSVFLRVLEYYDGILILTSNRVATFDEAFKSRIQLALHYDRLGEPQRKQIWQIFIKRLSTLETSESKATIQIEDLENNLDKLAKYDMNGRQIRNALTTARQLAMFKKKPMDFTILTHVIEVSSRFDKYLKGLNHGLTDDEIARDDLVR